MWASLDGNMDETLITKGSPGNLRQEFRELEPLNVITKLWYNNDLPPSIKG
jgi:hypothetical protein